MTLLITFYMADTMYHLEIEVLWNISILTKGTTRYS
jgi:hypothetical protein